MTIRSAGPDDLLAIGEIYAYYVDGSVATFELSPPDATTWGERLGAVHDEGLPFLVAEQKGTVVGYAYCSPWKGRPAYRYTVEDSVYLAPGAVGRGVGGRLLDALLTRCAAIGIREVIAVIADSAASDSAASDGAASLALHRKRGFVDAGRLSAVGFKFDRWLDTVLLQRSLTPADATDQ